MENKMEYEIKEETLVVLRTYWFYTIGEVKKRQTGMFNFNPKRGGPSTTTSFTFILYSNGHGQTPLP